jgi:ferrous iron transport protein B
VVALVGNPNSGKSTLFNALTGAKAQVSNYTGTTVERMEADMTLPGVGRVRTVDLPGTFSLAARSPEERIAIDLILGRSVAAPDVVVAIIDGPRLQRSLYLVLQLLELEVPLVVGVNLMDEARREGCEPDIEALQELLRVPVVPLVARSGEGVEALRQVITQMMVGPDSPPPGCPHPWSEALLADADEVLAALPPNLAAVVSVPSDRALAFATWLLLSVDDANALADDPDIPHSTILAVRRRATAAGRDIEAEIIGQRYAWIDARAPRLVKRVPPGATANLSERIDRVLLHPILGAMVFFAVMAVVFKALFAWSDPAITAIEVLFGLLGEVVGSGFGALAGWWPVLASPIGLVSDLVVEGIIGGVGAILVFLPQIGLLFLFIALLEDCGYLARAAHLMDRVLRASGLPGRAFVPLLSGFACAVPAIMATRTMPRFRDRLLTMMVIPLTSCSARLPVYTLIIAALFPATVMGWPFDVRPTVLFGMYLLSTLVTLVAATILGHTVLREQASPEFIELTPYRLPHPKTVARTVLMRMWTFVREAGRVILVATIVMWALLSFPRHEPEEVLPAEVVASAQTVAELEALAAPVALERSIAGRLGKVFEPVIAPLGYDWRIGIGIIGAFAAREVFVSTMGVVHGVGEVDEADLTLREQIRQARRPDGRRLYTPLTGLSIMVFFALAFQCLSTMAVLRRETGGWRWPAFIFGYMSLLAWSSAFLVYQGGLLLGFG